MSPFAALADPVRRDLLRRLAAGPARVVDLTAAAAAERTISRPAISKHLRLLGQAGLVTADPVGRERHYRLRDAGLDPVRAFLADLDPAPPVTPERLDALDLEVRRTVRERSAGRAHPDDTTSTTSTPSTEETG